jgi:NhaP-type Na+/H+ or K+/H+ antiporter
MIRKLKLVVIREFLYYIIIFLLLALIMHSDLLSNPSARFELMKEKENYYHPFLYTFILYSVMLVLRTIINFISKIFEKKSK